MPLVADALDELMTLAVPPRPAVEAVEADETPGVADRVEHDSDQALDAIDRALTEARQTGRRAAVCVAELSSLSGSLDEHEQALARLGTWTARHLRTRDRVVRGNDALILVASGLHRASEAEELAQRVRALPVQGPHGPIVGLAIFPTHGDDAATLLYRARASAARARLHPLPDEAVPAQAFLGNVRADARAAAPADAAPVERAREAR